MAANIEQGASEQNWQRLIGLPQILHNISHYYLTIMSLKKGRQKQYYEVEAIRDRRVNKQTGSREYLVKWKDWPEETNTWEPPCNLSFVIDMIQAF